MILAMLASRLVDKQRRPCGRIRNNALAVGSEIRPEMEAINEKESPNIHGADVQKGGIRTSLMWL
jgi:hypothetical protein